MILISTNKATQVSHSWEPDDRKKIFFVPFCCARAFSSLFSSFFFFVKMCVSPATVDLSTQANIEQVKTSHIHLNWNVDFEKQLIHGNVVLDLVSLVDNLEKVVLDTSYLDIQSASLGEQTLKVKTQDIHKSMIKSCISLILLRDTLA